MRSQPINWRIPALGAVAAVLLAVALPADAGPRGGNGYSGHHGNRGGYDYGRPGRFRGGVGLGLGFGLGFGVGNLIGGVYTAPYGPYYRGYLGGYGYPGGWVVDDGYALPPPVVDYRAESRPVPPAPAAPPAPDPVVYPAQGQSAERTEADRRDCNRWATTQPNAMADASVFHRAALACLEGRGYTVR